MDKQFLEFLGNFFINTAKGQRQMEEMARWMGLDFGEADGLTEMFRKMYGLEGIAPNSPDYAKAWEKASDRFRESFDKWIDSMDLTPKSKYLALKEKCDALEKELKKKDRAIERLEALLAGKGIPHAEAVLGFADLMEKQTTQFQELMEDMGKAFKPKPEPE